ncbi:MAG: hypothetical protein ABII03_00285 [Nanoarchaeota archaeon]
MEIVRAEGIDEENLIEKIKQGKYLFIRQIRFMGLGVMLCLGKVLRKLES